MTLRLGPIGKLARFAALSGPGHASFAQRVALVLNQNDKLGIAERVALVLNQNDKLGWMVAT